MWIGSQDGLNRFDGYSTRVYRNDPDDPNSLSNSFISALYTDKTGTLWIGTAQGLNRYEPKKETFTRYLHNPQDLSSLSSDNITTIFADRTGSIWIGTDGGGLNRLERETGNFIRYRHQASDPTTISHDHIIAIFEDHSGMFWVGTTDGLDRLNRKTGEFIHFKTDPDNPQSISHNSITAIFEDSKNQLWIGTGGGGLNLFLKENDEFIHHQSIPGDPASLSHNFVTAIFEDSTGVLWIGTDGGGLNIYDQQNSTFIHYINKTLNLQSLSNNLIVTILEDEAGILWFGTQNGISKFDRAKQKIAHYWHNPGDDEGLSDNYVSAIFQDGSGTLWVGTLNGGLNKFEAKSNRFVHYKHNPADPHSISSDIIYSIYEDHSRQLWIGTQNGGLARFDRRTETFIHYRHSSDNNSISNNFIWPIFEDSQNTLWVGTWGGGLNKFSPETGQFVHYKNEPDNPNSLSNDQLSSIIEDSTGKLWIGTFQGVNVFDPATGVFTHYFHDTANPQSLSNSTAVSIFEDHSGTVWVGTLGGLNRFDREKKTFNHYGKKDGLPNEVIASIMEDEHGMLWISTFNGISKFDPQKEVFENYDIGDGLQSRRFRANSHFVARDGQMFFGGINGFNAFYPEQLQDNLYSPPVVLTDFQLFNQSQKPDSKGPLIESITESNHIKLSHDHSVFSFEFASLHFSTPSAIRYAYQLEGFDKKWLYTDAKRRFATYTNIDGGTYTFRVKATNSDGVWGDRSAEITLTISSPFWKTGWFSLLLICLTLAVIGLTVLYLWKLKHEISQRKEAKNALAESEEKYRELIDSAPDLRYRTDIEGRIIFISQTVLGLSGFTVEEATGMKMAEEVYAYPEERDNFFKALQKKGSVTDFEAQLKRKDGSIWWASTNAHFYKDQSGNIIGVEGVTRDVTERKRAEQALLNEKEFTETALNSQQDTFFLFEPATGRAIRWNRAFREISGYSDEDIAGMTAPDSYHSPKDLERVSLLMKKVLETGTGTIELDLICKNGIKVPTEYNVSIIKDNEGNPKYIISIGRDTSERWEAEEEKANLESQLRQAHKMEAIGTLSGGIAHDFNNILTAILGFAEMANEDLPESTTAKRYIQEVLKAGKRAKELVKHILAFSRKSKQERIPVAIHSIAGEALKLLRASVPTTIEIHHNFDTKCGSVLADPTQIHQVIMNLCTNAAQAMDDNGGTLDVTIGCLELLEKDLLDEPSLQPGQYTQLTITDNGSGIDQNDIDRIFDPYFTTKEIGKGSGMGLAVVHGIVKSNDGMVTVDSAPGIGTTFRVFFPRIEDTGPQEIEKNYLLPTGDERILVVDDEESVLEITKLRLERLGYQVRAEIDSESALELLRYQHHGFDLIITDQTMPNMTGEQLAYELMELKSDIPIIICTGYSAKIDADKARALGINAFIMKPFDNEHLASTIRQVLDGE